MIEVTAEALAAHPFLIRPVLTLIVDVVAIIIHNANSIFATT